MNSLYAGASIGVGAPLSMEELDLGGSIGEAYDKLNLVVGSLRDAVGMLQGYLPIIYGDNNAANGGAQWRGHTAGSKFLVGASPTPSRTGGFWQAGEELFLPAEGLCSNLHGGNQVRRNQISGGGVANTALLSTR